jgi:hypothetical protein
MKFEHSDGSNKYTRWKMKDTLRKYCTQSNVGEPDMTRGYSEHTERTEDSEAMW